MFPWAWSLNDWWRAILVFLAAVLASIAIWWTFACVTGRGDPSQVSSPAVVCGLFLVGLVAAFFHPRAFWLAAAGVCLGQLLYFTRLNPPASDAQWLVSCVVSVVYAAAALLGALVGAVTMAVIHVTKRTFGLLGAVAGRLAGRRGRVREDGRPKRVEPRRKAAGGFRSAAGRGPAKLDRRVK